MSVGNVLSIARSSNLGRDSSKEQNARFLEQQRRSLGAVHDEVDAVVVGDAFGVRHAEQPPQEVLDGRRRRHEQADVAAVLELDSDRELEAVEP